MKKKKLATPHWWKSSYFWITAALVLIGAYGFAMGPATIADPGQTDSKPAKDGDPRTVHGDSNLPWLYLGAALLMGFNGIVSHRQYVAQYNQEHNAEEERA